jgi:NitT/TauT family transport system permease protein
VTRPATPLPVARDAEGPPAVELVLPATAGPPDRRARWRERWDALGGTTVAGAVVFFVVWELVVRVLEVPRYIVPAPSAVFRQFVRQLPLIWKYTLVTGGETLVGYVIACTVGVPLAMLVAFYRGLETTMTADQFFTNEFVPASLP